MEGLARGISLVFWNTLRHIVAAGRFPKIVRIVCYKRMTLDKNDIIVHHFELPDRIHSLIR